MRKDKGFSLVELLVVLALLAMVLAGAYQYFFFGYSSWNRASAEARVMQQTRLALLKMDREVREARKAMEAQDSVAVPTSSQLDIYTDTTGDGKPEMVRYLLDSGALKRGVSVSEDDVYPYSYDDPDVTEVIISTVTNTGVFTLDDTYKPRILVSVHLEVNDSEYPLVNPVDVEAELAVRSRGRAE